MGLFEILMPDAANAEHLKRISHVLTVRSYGDRMRAAQSAKASTATQEEVGVLALVLLSLVGELVEKGIITQEQLIERIRKLDALDGAEDGKLNPDVLRGALGLARKPGPAGPGPSARPAPGRPPDSRR